MGFTVKQLRNQLTELGLKSNGVRKVELEKRLLNSGYRFRAEFISSGYSEDIQKRPEGIRFALGGLTAELEQSFGIRPRGDKKNDLKMLESTAIRNNAVTSVCLRDNDYLINKKICRYCTFWDACEDLEFQSSQESQTYIFEAIQNNFNSRDISLIKSWLDARKENEHGLINQDHMVFSNSIDPFKPGFGINTEQQYFISRLSECDIYGGQNSSQWNHLYYSNMLKRTLTIFEAIYINSAVFQSILSLNSDGTYEESYPTLEQVVRFFKDGLQLRDLDTRKSIDKKRMIDGLENNDILGDDFGQLRDNDKFLSNFILNTKEKFDFGFFEEKVEIFSKFDGTKSFRQHLIDLWAEIGEGLLTTPTMEKNNSLFHARIQAQLLIPPVDTIEKHGLVLPNEIQLLRIVEVAELSEPWILSTDQMKLKISSLDNTRNYFPDTWLRHSWVPPQEFVQQLRDSPRKYQIGLWPSSSSVVDGTQLNVFLAKDIFSAFAMNTLQQKYTNSLGDVNQKKNHERFHNIMYDLFFRLLHEKETARQVENYEYLAEFWREFTHPKYKRLEPLVALRQLSEKDFNIENYEQLKTRFISFENESTPYGKHIERLTLESPSFINADNLTIDSFTWAIELAWTYDDNGLQVFENAGNWRVKSKRGRQLTLEKSKRRIIEDLLSWKPVSKMKSKRDVQNVFFSPMICNILNQSNAVCDDLIWRLIEILNQKAVGGCPIFCLEKEYETLEALAGKLEKKKVKHYSKDVVLCVAQSLLPVTDMSPNFLHVGTLN